MTPRAFCLLYTPKAWLTSNPNSLLRSNSGLHQAVPANFHLHPDGSENFLDYPPDSRSADEDQVFYNGVLTALGPRAETAVVKTLARCHVVCSTRGCRGLERLRVGNLVKIRHYTGGALEGRTFVADTAGECTPTASNAGSRVGSREGSRAPSREPSRPRSPVED